MHIVVCVLQPRGKIEGKKEEEELADARMFAVASLRSRNDIVRY